MLFSNAHKTFTMNPPHLSHKRQLEMLKTRNHTVYTSRPKKNVKLEISTRKTD